MQCAKSIVLQRPPRAQKAVINGKLMSSGVALVWSEKRMSSWLRNWTKS